MEDGSVQRFPSKYRHNYAIESPDCTGIDIPDCAKAMYHTHWDIAGKNIMVDMYGDDLSRMSREELMIALQLNPHKEQTVLGHSDVDFISIDSFVINRYWTSFSAGGSGKASPVSDSFLRFFPWTISVIK